MNSASPPATSPTFAVEVLGCKVNQHEAQQIRQELEERGWRPARGGAAPDLVIVHGCAVTAEALRQSRQRARRAAAITSRVILSGCAAALPPAGGAGAADAFERAPSGLGWRAALGEALRCAGAVGTAEPMRSPLRRFVGHTRAFVKAQDGCDLGCAYCIVPRLRGPPRDRPLGEIEAEARALAEAGHSELVISGVCVGLYGRGGGPKLAEAIRRVDRIESVRRLRLSSLHPTELTDDLLEAWAGTSKMCPHAHLPLQSGSDRMLRLMGRGYTAVSFAAAVERLRRRLDRPAITTDVIVGFPGETETDFEATLAFARAIGFSRLHVFRFSARPGTRAAALGSPVPPDVVRARAARAKAESERLAGAFHGRFIGETVEVLAETRDARGAFWRGYDRRYIPVQFAGGPEWAGRLARVRLTDADARGARGVLAVNADG